MLCFAGTAAPFPDSTGTRFYIMTSTGSPARLKKNDVIEVYRTRINTAGLEAGSEHYKAFEYEITLTDISNGYVDLPDDKTADDDLGVALYTNSAQDGETAQKYPPPRAKQLAAWSRCMWYGDVRPKARFNLRLVNFGASGYGYIRAGGVTFTSGSDLITGFADTSGFKVGEYLTDNLQHGPGTAGTYIPADSTITNITSATSLQISNLALASGTLAPTSFVQVMQKNVPRGLHAFRGTGTYTSGSAVVTGISDTTGLYAGMYVTDSANGPTTNGTRVPTGTLIQSVDSSTQITMTANALASGTAQTFIAGDYLTVNSVRFHAWPRGTASYLADDWTMPAQCFTVTGSAGQDASGGRGIMMLAMCNLATAVNRYCLATKGYHVRAIPLGDHATRWFTDASGGSGEPAAVGTIGISFEEIGQSGILPSLSTSCPTAWDVGLAATADDPTTLNRVYWSAVDEPEAVPLLNYVHIGAADKRVLALVLLRSALLVFKEDGCWRITGAPPSSWNVELLDPTLQLLRPEVVSVSQNAAYAWCRGGFFEVTENGAQSLRGPSRRRAPHGRRVPVEPRPHHARHVRRRRPAAEPRAPRRARRERRDRVREGLRLQPDHGRVVRVGALLGPRVRERGARHDVRERHARGRRPHDGHRLRDRQDAGRRARLRSHVHARRVCGRDGERRSPSTLRTSRRGRRPRATSSRRRTPETRASTSSGA